MPKNRKMPEMDALLFVDTNILLDFIASENQT